MRLMILALAATALYVAGAAAGENTAGTPLDIKGLTLGMPFAEVQKRLDNSLECQGVAKSPGTQLCNFKPDLQPQSFAAFGNASARAFMFVFGPTQQLGIVAAEVSVDSYNDVLAQVTAQFGKPQKTDQSSIKSKAGPVYLNRQATWVSAGDSLVVEKYGRNLENSKVMLSNSNYLASPKKTETPQSGNTSQQ